MPDDRAGEHHLTDTEVVARALQAVSDLDLDGAMRWIADDIVLELPYRAGGHPTTLVGADARAFIRFLGKVFSRMEFYDVVVHGATQSGVIAAEYKSNGLTKAGATYRNVYAAFFKVGDGRVTYWREYFNPDVIATALGRPSPQ